jgi:hypothetical protein
MAAAATRDGRDVLRVLDTRCSDARLGRLDDGRYALKGGE